MAFILGCRLSASAVALTTTGSGPMLPPACSAKWRDNPRRSSIASVTTASVVSVTCAVVCMLCSIRVATAPRIPVSGTTPSTDGSATAEDAGADRAAIAASTSSIRMRPCGPLPETMLSSMSFSRANRRAAGTTGTRPAPSVARARLAPATPPPRPPAGCAR